MRLVVGIIVGALLATTAAADDATSSGAGLRSCAEFAKQYTQFPTDTEIQFYSWAQGFMTGINLQLVGKHYNLGAETVDDQKADIRRYCDQHPLGSYYEAIISLLKRLPTLPDKK